MLWADQFMLRHALRFRPDLFLSFSSMYAAQVSSLLRKPHIAFDDTEHAELARRFYAPFTQAILSPSSYAGEAGPRQRRFEGFLELLYLHPNQFTPDPSELSAAGLSPGEPFSVVRFVSWKANHDRGVSGLTDADKRTLVAKLAKHGRVLISSEVTLPDELEPFRVTMDPTKIHHFLHFARVFVGESATMASESAMLGTPAVYVDEVGRGYTDELERKFELVSNFRPADFQNALEAATSFLVMEDRSCFAERRTRLLEETVDVNEFLMDVVSEVGGPV
jgi:uncharacterized protein